MTEFLTKYILKKWWIPLLLFILTSLSVLALISSTNKILLNISDYFFLFTFSLLLIAGFWQLIKGKWYIGILQLGTLFIVVLGIIFIASFMSMFGPDTDTFADNLKLPENVELEKPIDTKLGENFEAIRPKELENVSKDKMYFQLYNSFQPGLYEFDFWINSNQSGTIFLKVFEITQEVQLSSSSVRERSSLRINNTNGLVEKFSATDDFTIYEGDWGKPYGARFKIWFKPDNEKAEKKLMEKNYIIEGWMR
jgi:hypothetical protein